MKIKANLFSKDLTQLMNCQSFALLRVSMLFKYEDGHRTDEVAGVKYTLANPATFENFDVKIPAISPIISDKELQAMDSRPYVVLTNAIVKPYRIEYGMAVCSVTAESIKLVD